MSKSPLLDHVRTYALKTGRVPEAADIEDMVNFRQQGRAA